MAVTPPAPRWTASDLALLPDDGKRYEIIDGDLYVSKPPHLYHQAICVALSSALHRWSRETRSGLT
ncbi:MAG: Uma2 family endonuclease, partial [Chloroflexota bacterium]